jgi:hypothetical protein
MEHPGLYDPSPDGPKELWQHGTSAKGDRMAPRRTDGFGRLLLKAAIAALVTTAVWLTLGLLLFRHTPVRQQVVTSLAFWAMFTVVSAGAMWSRRRRTQSSPRL